MLSSNRVYAYYSPGLTISLYHNIDLYLLSFFVKFYENDDILDLHVGHVGGEAQKNILSIFCGVGTSCSGRTTLSGDSREIGCKSRIQKPGLPVCGRISYVN